MDAPQPLGALVDDWLSWRAALGHHRSAHTVRSYRSDLTRWAEALGGTLATLTPQALTNQAIVDAYTKIADGRAIATRQRYMSTLRGFCQWLTARGHLDVDPTNDPDLRVRGSSRQRTMPPHFDDDALRAIVRAINTPRTDNRYWAAWRELDLALFAVLLGSGLRAAEVCALTPNDILRTPSLMVAVRDGKGGADRRVPITPGVARRVDGWIDARDRRFDADPSFTPGPTSPLFVDRHAVPLKPSGVASRLRSWLSQADLPKPEGAAIHAFRHTAAHHWIRNGLSLPSVQARLGHTNLATTSIYTRLMAEETGSTPAPFDIDALLLGHSPSLTTSRSIGTFGA